MMSLKKKISLLFLFLLATSLVYNFAFAQIDLEQDYPSWSKNAPTLKSIVKNNSLGEVVQFFATWAIIISVLLAGLSLAYGGVLYLLASGKPSKAQDAKKRIRESLLGLLILAGSYLALQFINPQITILEVENTPISSGVVLFSKSAFLADDEGKMQVNDKGQPSAFAQDGSGRTLTIEELSAEGKLIYLNGTYLDLTKRESFGDLVAAGWDAADKPSLANFRNFKVFALGFWGDRGSGITVHFFLDKNLKGEEVVYTEKGIVLNEEVKEPSFALNEGSNIPINLSLLAFDSSAIAVEDNSEENAPPIVYDNIAISHPPLSIAFKSQGIGVNLFSDLKTADGMRFLSESFPDFRLFDFDKKTNVLELVTKDPKDKEPDRDLIVLVSSDYNFLNEGRIFFTKRSAPLNTIPKLYFSDGYKSQIHVLTRDGINMNDFKLDSKLVFNGSQENLYSGDLRKIGIEVSPSASKPDMNTLFQKFSQEIEIGNANPYDPSNSVPELTAVEGLDHYGTVLGASSLQLFELSDNLDVCRSVKVCDAPYGQGHCLLFSNQPVQVTENTLNLPMPWYLPVNIPVGFFASFDTAAGPFTLDEAKFADNLKSIYLDGNCLVVMYKHRIQYQDNKFILKEWSGAQNYTEAFTRFTQNMDDLTKGTHQMAYCAEHFSGSIQLGELSPCPSAIVVFPIK